MSLRSPRIELEALGLRPKASWGQNFLADRDCHERIAAAALLKPGVLCVELGAGLGHLTEALLATGATVIAVERDRELAQALRERNLERCTVVEANAATLRFAEVTNGATPTVVGNLPYHLTSPILFSILEQAATIHRAVFTVQKEVAVRLAASPGNRDYGLLSVLLQQRFSVVRLFDIPPSSFYPAPKVTSSVLRLQVLEAPRGGDVDFSRFKTIVRAAFQHRRKTLANALKKTITDGQSELFAAANIDGSRRPETLTVEEFVDLTRRWADTQGQERIA